MIVTRLKRMLTRSAAATGRIARSAAVPAIVLAGMLPMEAHAASFYEGSRAATNQQVEQQAANTHQIELKGKATIDEMTKENLSGKLTLKAWHGQTEKHPNGYWWFVGVPYGKVTTNDGDTNSGIADVTIGAGPIGLWKSAGITWGSYAAVTFPTGDTGYQRPAKDYSLGGFLKDFGKAQDNLGRLKVAADYGAKVAKYESLPKNRPALGTGRTDVSLGIGATKLFCDGKVGLNGAIDYTMTGTDNGNNPPDALSAGAFVDYGLTKSNIRVGTGLEYWCNTTGRHGSTNNDGASLTFSAHIPIKGYEYVIEMFGSKGLTDKEPSSVAVKFKHMF